MERHREKVHGCTAYGAKDAKMRFPDGFIFKGLLPLKMVAHLTHKVVGNAGSVWNMNRPCTTLVSVLYGRKLIMCGELRRNLPNMCWH
jgi:hypothetical protein